MPDAPSLIQNITSPTLPLIIEKLGLAIVNAQKALDENSIAVAREMASTTLTIGGTEYNLLSLGFTPTFYAYTEATVEAKLEFQVSESKDFSINGEVKVNTEMVGVSVGASYARKFSYSASGSSSFSARMVALPAPERLNDILRQVTALENQKI